MLKVRREQKEPFARKAIELANVDLWMARTGRISYVEWTTEGRFQLDTTVSYRTPTHIEGGQSGTWFGHDGPGSAADGFEYEEIKVHQQFRTYFMYKPEGDGNIWVTLGRMDWYWKAKARRNPAPPGTPSWDHAHDDDWGPLEDVDYTKVPVAFPTTELPVWSGNAKWYPSRVEMFYGPFPPAPPPPPPPRPPRPSKRRKRP